jgi:hypothetical protein
MAPALTYINDDSAFPLQHGAICPRGRHAVRQLQVRPLTPDGIAQAFPLIQAGLPSVTLEDWCDFATRLVSANPPASAGVMTVISEQGYIAGLSIFQIEADLKHGPSMTARHFLALDLFDRDAVVHAMAEGLEGLARDRRCTALHTHLPNSGTRMVDPEEGLVGLFRSRGHEVETVQMCKVLRQPA